MAGTVLRVSREAAFQGRRVARHAPARAALSGSNSRVQALPAKPVMVMLEPPRPRMTGQISTRHTAHRSAHLSYASSAISQSESKTAPKGLGLPDGEVPTWEIRMLHDGDCPLCEREVDMLKRRDAGKGKIDFVDISAEDYSPEQNMGLDYEKVMLSIHGILPDGTVISGVEVFRRLYEAVGLGWVYAITKNPTVGAVAENVYNFWARNRMAVTGRPDLEVILSQRKSCREGKSSSDTQ